jgi:hypothetical protein
MKVISKQRTHYPPATKSQPWVLAGAIALILLVGGVILATSGREQAGGTLISKTTAQDLGIVSMSKGIVIAQFPLTVQGTTRVTDIETSWMCTKARLVQADKISEWAGMSHGSSAPGVNVSLEPDQPAMLEVSIDPAAHGPDAVGPAKRAIFVTTASGQQLEFLVALNITR